MARNIPYTNTPQNAIALDPSGENSDWYMLTPKPVRHESPKLLKPSNYRRKLNFNSLSTADAGHYTNEEITKIWKRIVNHQHVETVLEILGESVTQQNDIPTISYNHQQYNFANSLWLNPDSFLQSFLNVFGKPHLWMMEAGLYFAVFSMIIGFFSLKIFV